MKDRLQFRINQISRERGIEISVLKAALLDFLRALHENQVKAWNQDHGLLKQVYLEIGDEASYHLCGLTDRGGEGMCGEELKYMDSSLKRFRTLVELWEFERDQEIEANK